MNPGRRSGITLTSVFALLALCACGTVTSPGPGAASSEKTDPARATTRAAATQPTMPDGGLACPATIRDGAGMTVPQPPIGVDSAARLLPDRTPSSMVVCAYPVLELSAATPLSSPFRLASRAVATVDQQARLADRLTWAPRRGGPPGPCTDMGGDETVYLVGTLFAGSGPAAMTWVAAKADPNSCSPATNGDFVARKGLGNDVGSIVNQRRPGPISSSGDHCVFDSFGGVGFFGRLGDDRSLAPAGNPSVTVCRPGHGQFGSLLDAAQSAQVVAVLRALPTAPSAGVCSVVDSAQDRRQRGFSLVLRYPAGPPSAVNVSPGCRPEVLGLGLQADDGSAVVKLVVQWSKPAPNLDPNGSVSSGGNTTGGGSAPSGSPTVMTTAIAPQPGTPPTAVPAPAHPREGASGILPQPPQLPNSSTSR